MWIIKSAKILFLCFLTHSVVVSQKMKYSMSSHSMGYTSVMELSLNSVWQIICSHCHKRIYFHAVFVPSKKKIFILNLYALLPPKLTFSRIVALFSLYSKLPSLYKMLDAFIKRGDFSFYSSIAHWGGLKNLPTERKSSKSSLKDAYSTTTVFAKAFSHEELTFSFWKEGMGRRGRKLKHWG